MLPWRIMIPVLVNPSVYPVWDTTRALTVPSPLGALAGSAGKGSYS